MKFTAEKRTYYRSLQHNHPLQQQYTVALPAPGQAAMPMHHPPMPPPQPVVPIQQFQALSVQTPQDEQATSGQCVVNTNNAVHVVKNACVVKHVQRVQYSHSNQKYFHGDQHNIPDEAILAAKLSDAHAKPAPSEKEEKQKAENRDTSPGSPSDETFASDTSDDGDRGRAKLSSHLSDSSQDSGCGMSDTSSGDNLDSSFSGEEDQHEPVHSNRCHGGYYTSHSYSNQIHTQHPGRAFMHSNGQNYMYSQFTQNSSVNKYHQTVTCHYGYETRPSNPCSQPNNKPMFQHSHSQTGSHNADSQNMQEPGENQAVCELRPIPRRFRQMLDEEARSNPMMYPGRFEGQALIRHKPLGNRKRKLARLAEMARLLDQHNPVVFEFNPEAAAFEPQLGQLEAESGSEEESQTDRDLDDVCDDSTSRESNMCQETDIAVEANNKDSQNTSSQSAEESVDDCEKASSPAQCDDKNECSDLVEKSSVESYVDSTVTDDGVSDSKEAENQCNNVAQDHVTRCEENVEQSDCSTQNPQPSQVVHSQVPQIRFNNCLISESNSTVCYATPPFNVPPPAVPYANDTQVFGPQCGYAPVYVNAIPSHPAGCPPPVMQPVAMAPPGIAAPHIPPPGPPMGTIYYPVYSQPPPVMQAPVQPYGGVHYQPQY